MIPGGINPLLLASAPPVRVQDVFAATTYTGNGGTQKVTNGLDLEGRGGLVWLKWRSGVISSGENSLYDTARGVTKRLVSNATGAESTIANGVTAFHADGFSIGLYSDTNSSGADYIAWAFSQADDFFGIVTYTGTGVAGREIDISHLGFSAPPGMVVVRRRDAANTWVVQRQEVPAGQFLNLGATSPAAPAASVWNSVHATADAVTLGTDGSVNAAGGTYVMYVFGHAPGGAIQCGSFATNGAGAGAFNHGWPEGVQFVQLKAASVTGPWEMYDLVRSPGWTTDRRLRAETSQGEDTMTRISDADGTLAFTGLSASATYVVLAIRATSA